MLVIHIATAMYLSYTCTKKYILIIYNVPYCMRYYGCLLCLLLGILNVYIRPVYGVVLNCVSDCFLQGIRLYCFPIIIFT